MKYKIGDKVKIINKEMMHYNEIGEITFIDRRGINICFRDGVLITHDTSNFQLAKQPKQKSTGKDSGNLPNTTNKAGGLSKSVFNSHYQSRPKKKCKCKTPLYFDFKTCPYCHKPTTSRPKPNKIEKVQDQCQDMTTWIRKLWKKQNEIIQVINYILEKI